VRSQLVAIVIALAALAGCAGAAASALASGSGGAGAATGDQVVLRRGDRGPAVRRLQRRLRVRVSGSFGANTVRSVRRFQARVGLHVDGKVGAATRQALGLRPFSRSEVYRPRSRLPRILRLIARCESGGNPRAVSSSGRYRGKYQFSRATWRLLGGLGDPALASERLQDRLALRLYRKRGTRAWPRCAVIARRAMRG
jgi:Transglycosylase-like domain/Putative peptidoglycan binding domain